MAVVTDELVTLFELRGATSAINDFTRISERLREIEKDEGRALTRLEQLNLGTKALGNEYVLLAGAVAAFTAVLGRAAAVFAEDEQAIFRTTVVLRNLKSSLPIAELQRFAQELQRTTAIDDEAVVAVGGLLARFGVAGDQIPRTLRSIVDASEATGLSLEQVGEAVGRSLLGQTRGLRELGIQFTATGNRARDLNRIREELDRRFGGAAEARRDTLSGSLQALTESVNNLLSAIGERLAPAIITIADALKGVTDFVTARADAFESAFFSQIPTGQLTRKIFGRQGNAAERIGKGGGAPATEGTLQEVAENTKKSSTGIDALLKSGGGPLARGALNFRGLNAALRAGR